MADSEYTTNSVSAGYNEANSVWPIGLDCRLSPDAAGPSLETPHGFHGHGGIVSMDPSSHGIERIWPLLSTQHVEHSPSGARVSNLRTVHRRCTDPSNVRKVFERLREFNIIVNPTKTKLGLAEVEYVGHVISATGTSFTEEKRLKVLQFPLPETQKNLLQFIGLANYFRDHVPNMTEMVQPLRGQAS